MVYLVSQNIISSLGFTSEENFNKIAERKTGISMADSELAAEPAAVSLTDVDRLGECIIKRSKRPQDYTRYEKLLICSIDKALQKCPVDISSPDTLLILSTTKGNVNLREKQNASFYDAERVQIWKSSEIIARFFNHPNRPITISNACISGALALVTAQRLLNAGTYKHAVVAGADVLTEFTLSGFLAFKAVSPEACKPFDRNRQGMTPGEGAACLILSSDKAMAGEIPICIAGGASSSDANHISGPSRTGEELAAAILSAMAESGTSPKQIDYVSAHGTATPYNDEMESKALSLAGLQHVPVNSFKGNFGHTFGAAGIAETVLSAESMRQNILLPSFGYEQNGVPHELNIIREKENKPVNRLVKTASGFGGCNAALVLSKSESNRGVLKVSNLESVKKLTFKDFRVFENDMPIAFDFYDSLNESLNFDSRFKLFSKSLYKSLGISYPKFYKMDRLCKLAFLGAEILLSDTDVKTLNPYKVAMLFSNGSGSSDTDAKYQQTIDDRNNYFPSPKIFVYTLANIMSGEISIRHGLKGENTVFIEKDFNKTFLFDYAKLLLADQKAEAVVAGRINFDAEKEEADLELYYLKEINKSL